MEETLTPISASAEALLKETGIPLHEYREIVRRMGREPNRLEL